MTTRRPSSGPRLRLSAERIVDAAIEVIRDVGYDGLSMRRLANRLDTGQASLYAHISNKAELDRMIVNRVIAELPRPELDPAHWREILAEHYEAFLALLMRYPGLASAWFGSMPDDEEALEIFERQFGMLASLGLTPMETFVVDLVLEMVMVARASQMAVLDRRVADSGLSVQEWEEAADQSVFQLPADRFPIIRAQAEAFGPDTRAWLTQEMIELILDGIEARYGATRKAEGDAADTNTSEIAASID